MRMLAAIFALLFGGSCATHPQKVDSVDIQRCSQLLGAGWTPSEPPALESELLAMASFEIEPPGVAWYSSGPGIYAACTIPRDRNECTYEVHEYREQIHRMWTYLSGAVRKYDCAEKF